MIIQVTSGTLTFSDGTVYPVGVLPNAGTASPILITPAVTTTTLLFTVGSVSSTTGNVGLSEIQVFTPLSWCVSVSFLPIAHAVRTSSLLISHNTNLGSPQILRWLPMLRWLLTLRWRPTRPSSPTQLSSPIQPTPQFSSISPFPLSRLLRPMLPDKYVLPLLLLPLPLLFPVLNPPLPLLLPPPPPSPFSPPYLLPD